MAAWKESQKVSKCRGLPVNVGKVSFGNLLVANC